MKIILGKTFYNKSETAEKLGVSLPTMAKYIREKRIRSCKVGHEVLISTENIMMFLQQKEDKNVDAD